MKLFNYNLLLQFRKALGGGQQIKISKIKLRLRGFEYSLRNVSVAAEGNDGKIFFLVKQRFLVVFHTNNFVSLLLTE